MDMSSGIVYLQLVLVVALNRCVILMISNRCIPIWVIFSLVVLMLDSSKTPNAFFLALM